MTKIEPCIDDGMLTLCADCKYLKDRCTNPKSDYYRWSKGVLLNGWCDYGLLKESECEK